MNLYRGVYPILFDETDIEGHEVNRIAINTLQERGIVQAGDNVIITRGEKMGVIGSTNTLKILTV